MRLLGIDLGTKTMGLAISDVEQKYISPLKKFDFKNENYSLCVKEIEKIIIQYQNEIEKIILGYPTKMNKEKTE
jgi:putative Holliday junction resolvase